MSDEHIRTETVSKLDLKAGNVLLIKVGGMLKDDMPWIPSQEDLEVTAADWNSVVPNGVAVVVSHHLINPVVVTGVDGVKNIVVTSFNGEKR